MLETLSVRDFALADSVFLEFESGFGILTGETGAGKSLIVGALAFLLGGKADQASIREGTEECTVSGVFNISSIQPALDWLAERSINPDSGHVTLRRGFKSNGRSIIYIQGQLVTRAELVEFSRYLVAIHGQHEQQTLLHPDAQLDLVDRFGGHQNALDAYRIVWKQLQEARKERIDEEEKVRNSVKAAEFLRLMATEISSAGLKKGEKEFLESEEKKLSQHEKLYSGIESVNSLLSGENGDGVIQLLRKARSACLTAATIDTKLSELSGRLENGYYEIEDIAGTLRSYQDSLVFDPARLEWIESRLSELKKIEKKYSCGIDDLLERSRLAEKSMQEIDDWDDRRGRMDARIAKLITLVSQNGDYLSECRRKASQILAKRIETLLQPMGMQSAEFVIDITRETEANNCIVYGASGSDHVDFLIAPNRGISPKPIARIASGGELSRIALAIKTAISDLDCVETLIFDEIDTGIGGEAAVAVGKHLKALGKSRQVLCITHLASIASMAGSHFRIEKKSDGVSTRTLVERLDDVTRKAEIARMLAGDQHEISSLAHAADLLRKALESNN